MQDTTDDEYIVLSNIEFIALVKFIHFWVTFVVVDVLWVLTVVPDHFMSCPTPIDHNIPYNSRNTKKFLCCRQY